MLAVRYGDSSRNYSKQEVTAGFIIFNDDGLSMFVLIFIYNGSRYNISIYQFRLEKVLMFQHCHFQNLEDGTFGFGKIINMVLKWTGMGN